MKQLFTLTFIKQLFTTLVAVFLLSSCEKSDIDEGPKSYVTARVNDKQWRDDDDPHAQLWYNRDMKAHNLTIYGGNMLLPDGNQYELIIYINHPVSAGKFYFNTNPTPFTNNEWAIGSVIVRRGETTYYTASSIEGFVDISNLTKGNLKGTFEYTAVTNPSSTHAGGDTIRVENGEFYMLLSNGSDMPWDGPK